MTGAAHHTEMNAAWSQVIHVGFETFFFTYFFESQIKMIIMIMMLSIPPTTYYMVKNNDFPWVFFYEQTDGQTHRRTYIRVNRAAHKDARLHLKMA